jgi:glutamine---fructose-6-phosphate transaminase (isomerizing)
VAGRGEHTENEILSQPACWEQCLRELEQGGQLLAARERFAHGSEWLFVGCGSSYYIALCAAAMWTAVTGMRARAIPASEVLLFPDLLPASPKACVPVLISRSGRTSEVVRAAEHFEKERNLRTLAVTCAAGQALEKAASSTICLPAADEQSTVMTRSFTSMMVGLQTLAAAIANRPAFTRALHKLPHLMAPAMAALHEKIRALAEHQFADTVFLGQGPFYGLACESGLKLQEMSCSYAQVFHTLEFRHGPKSIAERHVLVAFLLSETGYDAEVGVLEEVKALGATTLVVANAAGQRVRAAADVLVEFAFDVPEFSRLAAYAVPGQMLGLATGLKKGLDPDQPRHLARVVMLQEENGKPQHAAL